MITFAELSQSPRASAFLQAWADALASVLQQQTGGPRPATLSGIEILDEQAISAAERGLGARLSWTGPLRGEVALSLASPEAKLLAQLLAAEVLDPTVAFTDSDRKAASEFLRQAAGRVAADLKEKWGSPVEFSLVGAEPASWKPAAMVAIRVAASETANVHLIISLQAEFLAAFADLHVPTATTAGLGPAGADQNVAPQALNPNLELLLDVELEATIRFGQREMLLRDVLDLRSGAVIQLERHVEEPAELLVAGRLMARGDVVVVEGNYGLRITEILGHRQRYDAVRK